MATALAFVDSLPSVKRFRYRAAFSTHRQGCEPEPDPQYLILRDDQILMLGRAFCRDDAEAICDALEEAAEAGFEEAVEG